VVIDLAETRAATSARVLSVPFLETGGLKPSVAAKTAASPSRFFVSPHPAAILISGLLLRLAARFQPKRAVAQVFEPVSEIGPRGIEELQKQTVSLLTFQKIPRQVFGEQLAFNLLPRLGRSPGNALVDLEKRLRLELREYLEGRAPRPALRLFQVPVFYSLAVSLYVETAKPESPEAIAQALAGDPIHVRHLSQAAPSQVEATGSHGILVDTLAPDAEHPAGTWVWAVADNLRLAASNAVDIAFRTVTSPQ
jgi:aspartate-semialdehyde dehydrogenase